MICHSILECKLTFFIIWMVLIKTPVNPDAPVRGVKIVFLKPFNQVRLCTIRLCIPAANHLYDCEFCGLLCAHGVTKLDYLRRIGQIDLIFTVNRHISMFAKPVDDCLD